MGVTSNSMDLIGKIFYDAGSRKSFDGEDFAADEFRVKSLSFRDNKYICERLPVDGIDDTSELVDFLIGYVHKRVRVYEEE